MDRDKKRYWCGRGDENLPKTETEENAEVHSLLEAHVQIPDNRDWEESEDEVCEYILGCIRVREEDVQNCIRMFYQR